ncbi:MAG: hypothetical protein J6N15_04905 [Ruminiclostridium sp.]|nr:hypothetical protein [Ruminiclostridium sp.]
MSKVSGKTHSGSQGTHHANQSNPNNPAHTAAMNNHSNQCNPNNSAYHSSRGSSPSGSAAKPSSGGKK